MKVAFVTGRLQSGHPAGSAAGAPGAVIPAVRAREAAKRTILVIGALPPPYHGGSVVTQTLLESALADRYDLLHLDITDRRGVENIGRLDAGNVWLAAAHGSRFLAMLLRNRIDIVY
ncbi:MAG: hypothetical protein ACRELT_05990, partial [Longimicrobiales bacterium]